MVQQHDLSYDEYAMPELNCTNNTQVNHNYKSGL